MKDTMMDNRLVPRMDRLVRYLGILKVLRTELPMGSHLEHTMDSTSDMHSEDQMALTKVMTMEHYLVPQLEGPLGLV